MPVLSVGVGNFIGSYLSPIVRISHLVIDSFIDSRKTRRRSEPGGPGMVDGQNRAVSLGTSINMAINRDFVYVIAHG